jgi:FKBP-type peptidyl-prolyl cis-trans isomerase FkpA
MNRVLVLCMLLCGCLLACKKSTLVTDPAQIYAQALTDDAIIQQYITKNGLTGKVTQDSTGPGRTPTGVYYIIDTLGTGSYIFTPSTLVTIGYQASVLGSSTIFASTNTYHPGFILGQVIKGWQYGIPHIKKGGTITLFVPSRYAYGPYPQDEYNLPANSVINFKIKLYDISN